MSGDKVKNYFLYLPQKSFWGDRELLKIQKNKKIFRGTVFAASPTNIWELSSRPLLKSNIEFLKKNKHFDLAIELAVSLFFLFSRKIAFLATL